ncbi:MAG: hypothetical protein JKX70_00005 [Phycisphaerales bacterium]|nr:hypothetical protein [Phycisphaerales bacterium]
MTIVRPVLFSLAIGAAFCTIAIAQEFSNTLGNPGFGGSYVANFTTYDDGNGESLYATGSFLASGVAGGSQIARWDGSNWNAVGGGLQSQYSNTLGVFQGNLIVGGYFDSAGNMPGSAKLARFDGSSWNAMDAQLESFLSSIWDMTTYDSGSGDALIVAGNYLNIGGNAGMNHICQWDGTNYTALGGTIGGAVPLIVLDVLNADLGSGSSLFAGGRFLTIDGVSALNIASWDGSAWSPLGGGLTRSSGISQVFHLTTWDDGDGMALYAGGSFNRADDRTEVSNVAKWDGKAWSSMGDGFDSAVQELTVFDDGSGEALYAMGNFENSGASPMSHIAKWNGSAWEAVGGMVDGNIFGAIVYDAGEGDALIMGGGFNSVDGLSANHVVSLLGGGECPADLTGDGELNFFDVSAFLTAFSAADPAADFTGDGEFNFFDVSAFLTAFSAGCP